MHLLEDIKKSIGWINDCHENCTDPFVPTCTIEHSDGRFKVHHTYKLTDEMTKKLCNTFKIDKISLVIIDGPYPGDAELDYNLSFYDDNKGGGIWSAWSRHIIKILND